MATLVQLLVTLAIMLVVGALLIRTLNHYLENQYDQDNGNNCSIVDYEIAESISNR